MSGRVGPFMAIGVLGFVFQIVALALLTTAGWPLAAATLAAVELAILHNFCWHECWTWRDRPAHFHWIGRLARFHALTGVTSIGANLILTMTLVNVCQLPPLLANTVAVVIMSGVNFIMADRWVFARGMPLVAGVAAVCALTPLPAHAEPPRQTIRSVECLCHANRGGSRSSSTNPVRSGSQAAGRIVWCARRHHSPLERLRARPGRIGRGHRPRLDASRDAAAAGRCPRLASPQSKR